MPTTLRSVRMKWLLLVGFDGLGRRVVVSPICIRPTFNQFESHIAAAIAPDTNYFRQFE